MLKWKNVSWNEVLTIKNGKSHKKVINPNGKYPIYGSGGIMGYADEYLCDEGTTIIGRKGSINKPIFVDEKFWNVDTAFGLYPGDQLDKKFFFYFCTTYNFLKHNKATTLPSLTKVDLLKIKFAIPPLKEQKRIAVILDEADKIRQLNKKLIEHYEQLSQSLFLEMFGDPVSNPMGWELIKLGELGSISSGSTPSRKNDKYYFGTIPWVRTGEVKGKVISNTEELISEDALKNTSCRLYPVGSLIIAMYGQGKTRGQVGLLGIEAATNQACAVIPPTEKMNYIFLLSLLKIAYNDLRELGRGGNQPNLNGSLIKNYKVIFPSIVLQTQFEERVQEIEQQKEQAEQSLQKSEDLFQSLLQRAFRGEL